MNIPPSEIHKVINDYNLHIYQNIWHYSFNEIFQWTNFKFEKREKAQILYSRAYNSFSPLLFYTNDDSKIYIKEENAIQNDYDQDNENYRHIFWQLKIASFNNFLERRSKNSSKPKKHFPSLESYDKYMNKINGSVIFEDFNKKFFIENYNSLKQEGFLSGEEILELFVKNNPIIKYDWFRIAYLNHNNEIVAIAILVDDGKSLNLENIAAKRDSLSFGVVLCSEITKYCSEKNYYSFDAGVSGLYGNYKAKIFLDSREVYKKPESVMRYFKVWKISYWKKLKKNLLDQKKNE